MVADEVHFLKSSLCPLLSASQPSPAVPGHRWRCLLVTFCCDSQGPPALSRTFSRHPFSKPRSDGSCQRWWSLAPDPLIYLSIFISQYFQPHFTPQQKGLGSGLVGGAGETQKCGKGLNCWLTQKAAGNQ
ncbi:hypothetical protein MJT46_013691 [Ovis ammon polii x Ovis aries]|nr:hypothetical protein MJT46_013691 [Ovis ammon polii x Ovis aries]